MEENGLIRWFDNLKQGVGNKVIVFLYSNQILKIYKDKIKLQVFNCNHELQICDNLILNHERDTFNTVNHINITFYREIFKRGIIIIKNKNSIDEFIKQLESSNNEIHNKNIDSYLLKREDFYELLKLNKSDLKNFLDKRHEYLKCFYQNIPMWDENYIDQSGKLLEKNKILTANFAAYLYKFSFLEFNLSDTRIGINVRKLLGIKSKTINNLIDNIYYPDIKKTFKGYDMRYGIGFEIKKEIADKLLSLDIEGLELDKVCDITGLPKTIFKNNIKNKSLKILSQMQKNISN
ncbi:hypothetical protein [Arcobacter porcinus]|uniref:hypothetical protein n=1 Tax=Arcobacter porcinus TaxID=1935204 RepID=UPI000825EC89|nr:hypothetical protein [Arcobacter porcinus]OCL86138.1 hypothetical protein AAX30_01476 [Arcobacter porcinus]